MRTMGSTFMRAMGDVHMLRLRTLSSLHHFNLFEQQQTF